MSYLSDFQLLGCTSGTEAVVHFLKEQIVHITSELTDISSSNCPSGFGFLFFVFSLLVNSSLCLKVSFSTHFMYSEFWLLDNPYRCKSFTDTLYSIWNSLNTFTVENSAQWVHLKELLLQQIHNYPCANQQAACQQSTGQYDTVSMLKASKLDFISTFLIITQAHFMYYT